MNTFTGSSSVKEKVSTCDEPVPNVLRSILSPLHDDIEVQAEDNRGPDYEDPLGGVEAIAAEIDLVASRLASALTVLRRAAAELRGGRPADELGGKVRAAASRTADCADSMTALVSRLERTGGGR